MSVIQYHPKQAEEAGQGFFKTLFEGMYYLPLKVFRDERGYFTETGRMPEVEELVGHEFNIAQLNLSLSKTNVARGFHAEGWNKLVTVTTGVALCAWADLRPDSKTFGQVMTMKMGAGADAHFGSIYIPKNIANSFLTLTGPMIYTYAVDRLYKNRDQTGDVAISLFDPDLDVEWPIDKEKMIVSQRDVDSISLRDKFPQKFK